MSKIMTVMGGFYKPDKIQLNCQTIMYNIGNTKIALIPPKVSVINGQYCRGGGMNFLKSQKNIPASTPVYQQM